MTTIALVRSSFCWFLDLSVWGRCHPSPCSSSAEAIENIFKRLHTVHRVRAVFMHCVGTSSRLARLMVAQPFPNSKRCRSHLQFGASSHLCLFHR